MPTACWFILQPQISMWCLFNANTCKTRQWSTSEPGVLLGRLYSLPSHRWHMLEYAWHVKLFIQLYIHHDIYIYIYIYNMIRCLLTCFHLHPPTSQRLSTLSQKSIYFGYIDPSIDTSIFICIYKMYIILSIKCQKE